MWRLRKIKNAPLDYFYSIKEQICRKRAPEWCRNKINKPASKTVLIACTNAVCNTFCNLRRYKANLSNALLLILFIFFLVAKTRGRHMMIETLLRVRVNFKGPVAICYSTNSYVVFWTVAHLNKTPLWHEDLNCTGPGRFVCLQPPCSEKDMVSNILIEKRTAM